MVNLARKDKRLYLITIDMGFSVLEAFQQEFPDRFLNVGIAEQNAVGVACGLALSGWTPVVYSIVPFVVFRCFEQVRNDIAYMNVNVKLVGVGAGLGYGPAGPTHHALTDIAVMRVLPNMSVCCPGDPYEASLLTEQCLSRTGPVYMRLGKGREPVSHKPDDSVILGEPSVLAKGSGTIIITTSNSLDIGKKLSGLLADRGQTPSLVSLHTIKPIAPQNLVRLLTPFQKIITIEEHSIIGGLASLISEIIASAELRVSLHTFGIMDTFISDIGTQEYLRNKNKLSAEYILEHI